MTTTQVGVKLGRDKGVLGAIAGGILLMMWGSAY